MVLCDQFVTFGSLLAISYAAQRTDFETEYWTRKLGNHSWNSALTNLDLKRAQRAEFVKVCFFISLLFPFCLKSIPFQGVRDWFADVQVNISDFPMLIRAWSLGGLVAVLQPWVDASEGKRLCWKICMLNAAVWAAWKVSRWQSFMVVRFMHNPLSGLSYTLLTSMFRWVRAFYEDVMIWLMQACSHRGLLHLVMNCLALEGFGEFLNDPLQLQTHTTNDKRLSRVPLPCQRTRKSKTTCVWVNCFLPLHVLLYLWCVVIICRFEDLSWLQTQKAGLFSGLVSHVVSTKFRYPRAVAQFAAQANSTKKIDTWASAVSATTGTATSTVAKRSIPDILPSLGASGAIYASVVVTALAFPNSQIALFIPPSYPINIQYGVGGLVLMDTIGILRGWRYVHSCGVLSMGIDWALKIIWPLGTFGWCCIWGSLLRVWTYGLAII